MDELLNITRRVVQAIKSDKIRRVALTTTLAVQKDRIFNKGQRESGGQIGKYSEKYGKMKAAKGRNPGYVNFRNTDQLMNDYGVQGSGDDHSFGFQNAFNADKAGFLMDRYGDVFHVSDSELNIFSDVLMDETNKAI